MAERPVVNVVQQLTICAICVEEVRDPRALQCQHTYCYNCLVSYIETKDKKDQIECPICRQLCPIPNGKIENLQVNFFFNHLKDAGSEECKHTADTPKDNKPTCSNPDCNSNTATVYCEVCKFICEECENQHKTVFFLRKHTFQTVEEGIALLKDEVPPCPKHRGQLLQIYCETCSLPICPVCYPLAHAQHTCVELTEKASSAKEKLKEIIDKVHDYLELMENVITNMQNHGEKIRKHTTSFKQGTVAVFEGIHKELKVREESIQSKVDKACQLAEKTLQGEVDRQEMLQATLQSILLCGNQLLQHGKPCDYLTSVPSLSKQLHDNNPECIPCVLPELDLTESREKLADSESYEELCSKVKLLDEDLADYRNISRKQREIIADLQQQLRRKNERIASVEKYNKKLTEQVLDHKKKDDRKEKSRHKAEVRRTSKLAAFDEMLS